MVWELKKLSDVVEIISGGTPKSGVSEYWADEVPWITPKDMGSVKDRFVFETSRKISKLGLAKSSAKLIPENSVILSTRAPIGYLVINTVPMATNQGCRGLVVSEKITTNFLYYFLKSNVSLLNDLGTGTTFKELSKTALSAVHILVPHVEEQKRIVAILDEAFEQIDQAKANAAQNLKNACELFESSLSQIFTQRDKGWAEVVLSDVAEVSSGGTPTKSTKEFWNGDIPWYSSGELNDLFTKDSKEMITQMGLKSSNAKLFPKGSLLIGMYDTAALKMSILDRDGTFNQAIAGVKPNDNVNLNFIRFYIDSIKPELMAQRRGVRQKNLNQSKIKGINLVLPTISVQNKIASEIIKVKQQTESLESIYQQKITALDELKQSLLQKAFSGELTQSSIGDSA